MPVHTRPTCLKCGSHRVLADAFAIYNEDTQEWELLSTFDHHICDDCGEENNWEMQEMP